MRTQPSPTGSEAERQGKPLDLGTSASQHHALESARAAATSTLSETLLRKTGPLAELESAARRGILDETRRILIAKKGRGVVFEAHTVIQAQEAAVRYDLRLAARLAQTSNAPNTDILVTFLDEEIGLQLKAGSDRYIKAAIRVHKEGILFVPKDAALAEWAGNATGTLSFDDVSIESPTRDELLDRTRQDLDKLGRGEPAFGTVGAAREALCRGLVDGIVAAVLDLSIQKLTHPDQPIDWHRTARNVLRSSATSAVSSFFAATSAQASVTAAGRAANVTSTLRAARVAACVAPHLIDVGTDALAFADGSLSGKEFARSASGHAAAATAEYLAFPLLARLAAPLGRFGVVVFLVGGYLVSKLGTAVGQKAFDFLSSIPPEAWEAFGHALSSTTASKLEGGPVAIQARITTAVETVRPKIQKETERREALAEKRLCEEAGCGGKHHARGWCSRHYQRWWRRQRRVRWAYYGLPPRRSRRPLRGSSANGGLRRRPA